MPTSYTTLLGLALPVTGELSGTWGDVVSNYITQYLDSAVAGTQTISGSQTAVTLSVTNGSSLVTAGSGATGSAQFQIINCTGNPAGLLTITAPASSRQYIIINATSTSQSVKIVGTGPTTGVTLIAGEKAHVAWNGSDFVKIATTAAAGGSNTQVQYNSSGVLAGSSNMTFDGTNLTVGGTASATKLIPTGGAITGNGMYLPAANSVAITTNGAQAIYIDSSQNVGVGTSSLTARFESQKDSAATSPASDQSFPAWTSGAVLKNLSATNGAYSALSLLAANTAGTTQGYSIASQSTSSGYASNLLFIARTAAGTGTVNATLDSSGNLGLGVTPSAWSQGRAFEVFEKGYGVWNGTGSSYVLANAYFNTNFKYANTGAAASHYYQYQGAHVWSTAASGTAGNTISFTQAMTLDANGNFYVGTTSQSGGSNITFNQPANADMKIAASVSTGTRAAYQVFVNTTVTTVGTENSTGGSLATGTSAYATVLANSGAYPISFATNNTERMRLDSSGNLGIGTTSPGGYRLAVVGTANITNGASQTFRTGMLIEGGGTASGDLSPALQFSSSNINAAIYSERLSSYGGNLIFATQGTSVGNPTERARITSGGDFLVSKTAGNDTSVGLRYVASQYLSIVRDGNPPLYLNRLSSDGRIAEFARSSTIVGSIDVTTTATSYVTSSDYRLKENIQPMTGALAKVAALKPCTYKWKADGSDGEGFIAHELAEVAPQCVTGEKDAVDAEGKPVYQGIDTSFLVATLTAAIQEQQALIQSLTARIAALESKGA